MAADMTTGKIMEKVSWLAIMLALLPQIHAVAADFVDPTRPAAGEGIAIATETATAKRGLQSVIISSTRCAAILDGKTILLGERYGEERLIEISLSGVVLQGRGGEHTLALFPSVDKKLAGVKAQEGAESRCRISLKSEKEYPATMAGEKEKQ